MDDQALKRASTVMEDTVRHVGGLVPLADICGVNPTSIWRARETGHVPPKIAIRMNVLLGVPLRDTVPRFFDDTQPQEAGDVD